MSKRTHLSATDEQVRSACELTSDDMRILCEYTAIP